MTLRKKITALMYVNVFFPAIMQVKVEERVDLAHVEKIFSPVNKVTDRKGGELYRCHGQLASILGAWQSRLPVLVLCVS